MCEVMNELEWHRVLEEKIPGLEEAFAKLGRKAAKLHLPAPKLVRGEVIDVPFRWVRPYGDSPYLKELPTDKPFPAGVEVVYQRYVMLACEGDAPVLDGWELISVIDHTTDSDIGNIIRDVPGKETPVAYRTAKPYCDHCHTERRRSETFLIKKDGVYRQIGRNCLADFCRDPEMAAGIVASAIYLDQAMNAIRSADDDEYDRMHARPESMLHDLMTVLELTRRFSRQLGFVSKGQANIEMTMSTSSIVSIIVNGGEYADKFLKENREVRKAFENKAERDLEEAKVAVEWIRAMRNSPNELNDYLYNLLVVCSQERIPGKQFGLACSLMSAWMRAYEKAVEEKVKATRKPSEHFGTVKKRETFLLTVTGVHEFEGTYGVTTFIRFLDSNFNVAVWKASGSSNMEVGKTYSVKGTVKEHGDYKGTKQTVLSRCKYEEVEETD